MALAELKRGLLLRNPVFVAAVGLCPAVAVTTTARAAIDMGLAISVVLVIVNILASLTRKLISERSRLPVILCYSSLAASLVLALVQRFLPGVDRELGLFLPLAAVNCLVLERASLFARRNTVAMSLLDAVAAGLGYTAALLVAGIIREALGSGTFFGIGPFPYFHPVRIFATAPGGFLTVALILAMVSMIRSTFTTEKKAQ